MAIASTAASDLGQAPVQAHIQAEAGALPLVVDRRTVPARDADQWLHDHRERLHGDLLSAGAILLRGFHVENADQFRRFVVACAPNLLEYQERSSPRTHVADQVYTSTDHPAAERIFPHNEHSYARRFPLKLFFGCLEPARRGGETPLADCRRVTARISQRTKERFREKQWLLVRNFNTGFGVSWATAFQTESRAEVERLCHERAIELEWGPGDRLRTRQVRPAMIAHPSTGELLWFNHATFFHVSTLDAAVRDALLASFGEADLPTNSYYGDGTSIEPAVLDELRAAYERELVTFTWQKGDVLMIDNVLVAHARTPFEGSRRVVVAMADPYDRSDF